MVDLLAESRRGGADGHRPRRPRGVPGAEGAGVRGGPRRGTPSRPRERRGARGRHSRRWPRRAADPDAVARARELDDRLHDLVRESCGNAFLAAELNRLQTLFRTFRDVTWDLELARRDFHRIAVEATNTWRSPTRCSAGDARAAARAMTAHIRSGVTYWTQVTANLTELPSDVGRVRDAPLNPGTCSMTRTLSHARAAPRSVATPRHRSTPGLRTYRPAPPTRGAESAPMPRAKKPQPGALEYNRDIRPILAENCFACHGPDSAARKADLRLDQPRRRRRGRRPSCPGKPDESELIDRILADDANGDDAAAEVAQEADRGAEGDAQAVDRGGGRVPAALVVHRPDAARRCPTVKDKAWVRNPIDRFVLAKLESRGPDARPRGRPPHARPPARARPDRPAARRRPTSRRSSTTQSPNAYEKYVDKLLASPHWGEHRGRYWLDAARYADTHGIHFDNYREMWAYRDWVINAFNANHAVRPVHHRATRRRPAAERRRSTSRSPPASTAATSRRTRAARSTRSTSSSTPATAPRRPSQVWLGLTAGCAVCHDHKFDPLSQKEFYALSAFFNNTTQSAMDGNIKDTPPIISGADGRGPAALGQARQRTSPRCAGKLDARKATAAAGVRQVARRRRSPTTCSARSRTTGLTFHAPLDRGRRQQGRARPSTASRDASTLGDGYDWAAGPRRRARRSQVKRRRARSSVPDAGDFDTDQPFSVSALGASSPSAGRNGAIVARMDDGERLPRLGPVGRGRPASARTSSTSGRRTRSRSSRKTPLPAEQVDARRRHLRRLRQGRRASRSTSTASRSRPTSQADTLKSTTRTDGAVQDRPAAHDRAASTASRSRTCASTTGRSTATRSSSSPASRRAADMLAKPADKRTDAGDRRRCSTGGSATHRRAVPATSAGEIAKLQAEEATIKARGTIAHVMQREDRARRWRSSSSAASTTSGATR